MIKGYFNFRLFSLLESILVVNPDFFSILESIAKKGDPVAQSILDLVNKDIKTNVNYLKPSDKNDDLKFINDTQVQRLVDAGKDHAEIFSKPANSAKIGRTVRQILKLNNISVTDAQVEKFVNLYKNAWDKKYSKLQEGFSLIKGEAIRDWYLESNYVKGGGQLNSSCMRYESTQSFLDIYTENPDVCQLLILVDNNNKLLGRALLWKLVEGSGKSPYYLDRIYTRYDSDIEKFKDWFRNFIKMDNFSSHFTGFISGCRVKLKKWKFEQYPYMDTFVVLGSETGILKAGREANEVEYILQGTEGGYSVPGYNWSHHHNTWIRSSDAIYLNDDYYFKDECIRDYNGDWILEVESVWSDFYGAYIHKEDAIELEGFGTVSKFDIITVYDDLTEDGVPIKPRKHLISKIKNDYIRVRVDGGSVYMNRKFMIYDIDEESWILNLNLDSNMKILYNVDDILYSMLESMELIKIDIFNDVYCKKHEFLQNMIVSYIPFIINLYGNNIPSWFATEESLKCFDNVDIDSLEKATISKYNYYRNFINLINDEYDKQLEGIKNYEYKIDELEEAISYVSNSSYFKSNNDLYKMYKSDGDILRTLNELLANEFASFNILDHLHDGSNMIEIASYMRVRGFSYIDSNGNLSKLLPGEDLPIDVLRDFIKEYEYYILLYVYIYIIEGNRDLATDRTIKILKEDNNIADVEDILYLFTYNNTFPTFSKIINANYNRGNFEKRDLFKSLTNRVYKPGFDIFYRKLKSLQK